MSDEAASHDHTWNENHQAKRAACDRCRRQKLRCIRESQGEGPKSGKCIRCDTAGAVCSFSLSKRAGRPPIPTNSAEKRARVRSGPFAQASNRGHQLESAGRAGENLADSQPVELCSQIPSARRETNDGIEREAGNTRSMDDVLIHPSESSLNESAWEYLGDQSWPEILYDGPANSKSLPSFSQDYDWSLTNTLTVGESSDIHTSDLMNDALPTQLDEQIFVLAPPQPGFRTPRPQAQKGFPTNESQLNSTTVNTTSCPQETQKATVTNEDTTKPTKDILHQRMHRLSEMALDLHTQVTANQEYRQSQSSTGSLGLREQLVGNVIKSSVAFLALLESFYPQSSLSAPSTNSAASIFSSLDSTSDDEVPPSNDFTFSDIGSDFTTDPHPAAQHWNMKQQQRRISTTSPSDQGDNKNNITANKPIPADMATIFQLLTCYIRIVHLHSIFYTQVHTYLTSALHPPPPLFPGIAVGGVPLDAFRNFQVKLLLQISTHVLGEIEIMLGLPEGYRISRRGDDEDGKGILETSVSVQFVEMTMREYSRTGWGIGRDRVRCIRDVLGGLRVLLRGSINI